MKVIIFMIFLVSLWTGYSKADAPQWRGINEYSQSADNEILSPAQREKRARKKAFHQKVMNMSYGDLEETARTDKVMARYLKKMNKKGIKNAAHYEQYKARRKGEKGRQMYPRSWRKAGHDRDNIYEQRVKEIQ